MQRKSDLPSNQQRNRGRGNDSGDADRQRAVDDADDEVYDDDLIRAEVPHEQADFNRGHRDDDVLETLDSKKRGQGETQVHPPFLNTEEPAHRALDQAFEIDVDASRCVDISQRGTYVTVGSSTEDAFDMDEPYSAFAASQLPPIRPLEDDFGLQLPGRVERSIHDVQMLLPTCQPHRLIFTDAMPAEIRRSVREHLAAVEDCEFRVEIDQQITGWAILDLARCSFNIDVYQRPQYDDDLPYAFEVHHWGGDAVAFSRFFCDLVNALVRATLLPTTAARGRGIRVLDCPPCDPVDSAAEQESLRSLASHALSTFIEPAREGSRLMACRAAEKEQAAVFVAELALTLDVLRFTLSNPDGDVQRCGAAMLARLAANEEFRAAVLKRSDATILLRTVQGASQDVGRPPQCQRELRRALELFGH